MEFIKNKLINAVLEKNFETFSKTLDTADYVPAKYGKKIHKYIFKNMKRKFKEVDRAYRNQKKVLAKTLKDEETEQELQQFLLYVIEKEKAELAKPQPKPAQ